MALAVLHSGRWVPLSAKQGRELWEVLQGRGKPDAKQVAFADRVRSIHLNWRNAPDDYITINWHRVLPYALRDWEVYKTGKLARPCDEFTLQFCLKWGLYADGAPTSKVPLHLR